MRLFLDYLLAGALISAFVPLLSRLNSMLRLPSHFRFFFMKTAVFLIAAAPAVSFIAPTSLVMPVRSAFVTPNALHLAPGPAIANSIPSALGAGSIAWSSYFFGAYLFFFVVLCARRIAGIYQLRRVLQVADKVAFPGCQFPVYLSRHAATPFSVGLFTSAIVLPEEMRSLGDSQLHIILQHETIHLRRKDHFFKAFGLIVELVWFFWPPIYKVVRDLEFEMEASCDAALLAQPEVSRREYCDLLLQLAEGRRQSSAFAVGVADSILHRRFMNMKLRPQKTSKVSHAGMMAVLLAVSVGISMYTVRSQAGEALGLDNTKVEFVYKLAVQNGTHVDEQRSAISLSANEEIEIMLADVFVKIRYVKDGSAIDRMRVVVADSARRILKDSIVPLGRFAKEALATSGEHPIKLDLRIIRGSKEPKELSERGLWQVPEFE